MKKYQVFVSSTFRDLIDERTDAIRAILDLGHIPSGMELFPSADIEQFEYIKKVIDECDYYVLIIGARYGSEDESGISYTEKEFDYAAHSGKTILAFIHNDTEKIVSGKVDYKLETVEKLQKFRSKVSSGRLVSFWTTREGLEAKVIKSLAKAFSESPALGWVRGGNDDREELLEQINKLRLENEEAQRILAKNDNYEEVDIDDLAGLDDKFDCNVIAAEYSDGSGKRQSETKTITWGTAFSLVAPSLLGGLTTQLFSKKIIQGLRELFEDPTLVSISSTDADIIKVQMLALGLVKLDLTDVGGEKILLTDKGKATMFKLMAVKKDAGQKS
ncbi:conserved hypothetical protein [Mesorhizobium prunaredense]|uniref:DUF4062 domain-containing protein n=1 Tax=Mesorhizobium prunaredense TaxID=1631249 RepID=A0A1R3V340_9HYPH|nr:DUF4062 domain-containing protein [Mesorhizobium prunaredense]SIT52813.1 conserved hypothetical protein [Mesorhizobium prunaredense]